MSNPPDLQEAILRIKYLPTIPAMLGKILSTAADPEASALDLGKLIASDQSLSAAVLRLVNSAYYGFYRQIMSVSQAIVMLGFFEARNITLTATAFRSFPGSDSNYNRTLLWRHSLATAMAAEKCAKLKQTCVIGCFESGLLHDIGKVVFDVLFPAEFRIAAGCAHERVSPILEVERELFQMDHAEVGALLGEHWNLPEAVVEAIRLHHNPEKAIINKNLTAIITVANYITYGADLGETSNGCAPVFPETAAAHLKLTWDECEAISNELRENHARIDDFLGALDKN